MADLRTIAAFFPSNLASPFTRFLRSHAFLQKRLNVQSSYKLGEHLTGEVRNSREPSMLAECPPALQGVQQAAIPCAVAQVHPERDHYDTSR